MKTMKEQLQQWKKVNLMPAKEKEKQSLRVLKEMKAAIEAKLELLEQDLQDKTLINSMISEVEFAIQWMVSSRNPDARRKADRIDRGLYAGSKTD